MGVVINCILHCYRCDMLLGAYARRWHAATTVNAHKIYVEVDDPPPTNHLSTNRSVSYTHLTLPTIYSV